MKDRKFTLLIVVATLLTLALAACGDPTATTAPATTSANNTATTAIGAKQQISIALSYIPNVQFAPFYVAQDKGYFAAEGLDVKFEYGTINDLMAVVGQGKIPFALASGDEVLQARAGGIPVTYIATMYQKYPVALASLKGKGITKPADLKGKTIGIPGQFGANYIGLKALLASAKLEETDINEQVIGFTQREALSQGKVEAAMVYSMNEPVQLQKEGVALDVIEVSSIANLASVGLVTSESLVAKSPDLVQKMVRAYAKGLKDTIDSPDAAFASTIKVAPDAKGDNPDLQKQVLVETVKFMTADSVKGQPIGYSDPKVWESTEQFMVDNKLMKSKVDLSATISNKYVSADIGKYK